ncbi:hypothetical protein FKP32DRAFT_1587764 [Trametes sanguinea]|nr:hypothetical protein FKP32DRAFT_1587764 [Trametes sanguinea]
MVLTDSTPSIDYRLPTDVVPKHYDLTIHTDLQNATFDGVVRIDLHIVRETSKIVFNTLDLELDEITLQLEGHEDVLHESKREFDRVTARGIITFPQALPAGTNARLTITFEGKLTSSLSGYYRCVGDTDGKNVYSLTQFQPTAARKAFPCWDEPALKATFDITMLSKFGSVNLSNMPAQSEKVCTTYSHEEDSWLAKKIATLEDPSLWKVTRFQTTPPISTYLVAYANGPFKFLESSYKSPLSGKVRPLRIYATADYIWQGQFALDVVQKVMPLYEEVFDVEYPLPKLDILASSDFDLGGMENWGLIIGRTSCFLDDPNENNLRNKQYVASMASHEVAHMWFGDITTMEWWDNLYLNEGFATLVGENFVLGGLFPEWRLDAQFLGSNFYPARSLDAKLSSHPIEVECPDANKIIQIFDNLSYSKAASVLRMLASYVGQDKFLKGVSAYLKKHKYKNTVTSDLWEGIQSVINKDIPGMMDNWVKKMGYPIISVTEKEGGVHVRQERFLETGPADPAHNETIWTVPLSILTVNEDGSFEIHSGELLAEREKFIPLDMSRPFKLNSGTTGFYVVQYSPERLITLGKQAVSSDSPFSLQDRIGLVRDAFALASSGHSSVGSALGLVNSMRATDEYLVWDAVAESLSRIASTWWEHPEVLGPLNAFRKSLFVPIAKRLGFEPSASDTTDDQQLRVKAIEQAAEAGDPWAVGEMTARFAHFLDTGDGSEIPSELAGMIYHIAVQEGGKREWDFLKNVASNASSPSQSLAAMSAMGATRNRQLAEATFQYATTEARDQNVVYFFRAMQRNLTTRRWLASKVLESFDMLEKRYTGTFTFNRLIDAAFGGLASQDDYEKVAAFFKDKDTAAYDMQLHQTLDTIKFNVKWIERSTEELKGWLEEHMPA